MRKPTHYKIKSVHGFQRKENEKHVIWTEAVLQLSSSYEVSPA